MQKWIDSLAKDIILNLYKTNALDIMTLRLIIVQQQVE